MYCADFNNKILIFNNRKGFMNALTETILLYTKFLLKAKSKPKNPPNKIRNTWQRKVIIPLADSIIYPPIFYLVSIISYEIMILSNF